MATEAGLLNDVKMEDGIVQPDTNVNTDEAQEPKYGGFTRFEIELEFVQCLANPHYLLHLATLTTASSPVPDFNNLSLKDDSSNPLSPGMLGSSEPSQKSQSSTNSKHPTTTPLLSHPPFIAYLEYLQYFSHPPYLKYLTYPGPTLKNLELLQSERFRREVLSPDVVGSLIAEGREAVAGGNVGISAIGGAIGGASFGPVMG